MQGEFGLILLGVFCGVVGYLIIWFLGTASRATSKKQNRISETSTHSTRNYTSLAAPRSYNLYKGIRVTWDSLAYNYDKAIQLQHALTYAHTVEVELCYDAHRGLPYNNCRLERVMGRNYYVMRIKGFLEQVRVERDHLAISLDFGRYPARGTYRLYYTDIVGAGIPTIVIGAIMIIS